MAPSSVEAHYRSQQRLAAVTVVGARSLWADMRPEALQSSWPSTRRRLLRLLSSAQTSAASAGASYVPVTLDELGVLADTAAEVNESAFAGWSSSGTPMGTVLDTTMIRTYQARADGATPSDALAVGLRQLEGIALTQIADAARGAAGVAIAARPPIGYVRMLNPPSCDRCAILAGRRYRWNQGFQRHRPPLRLPAHPLHRKHRRGPHHRPARLLRQPQRR